MEGSQPYQNPRWHLGKLSQFWTLIFNQKKNSDCQAAAGLISFGLLWSWVCLLDSHRFYTYTSPFWIRAEKPWGRRTSLLYESLWDNQPNFNNYLSVKLLSMHFIEQVFTFPSGSSRFSGLQRFVAFALRINYGDIQL